MSKTKIISTVLLMLFCIAVLVFVFPRLTDTQLPDKTLPLQKCVLTMWNVESFEGGIGSRSAYITRCAASFESKHNGVYVHVDNVTLQQALQRLQNGDKFDLLCFPRGAGDLFAKELAPLSVSFAGVKQNVQASAMVGHQKLAAPLYMGGYCLFSRQSVLVADQLISKCLTTQVTKKVGKNEIELRPFVCGFWQFGSPLTALSMCNVGGGSAPDTQLTQYEAYDKFVAGDYAATLLGTQRDLYRLSKREANGKIDALSYVPLTTYTDLVQYLGVCSGTTAFNECEAFVQHMLSDSSQQRLTSVGMFSVLEKGVYSDERYVAMENALNDCYVPSAFCKEDAIAAQRQTALTLLFSK